MEALEKFFDFAFRFEFNVYGDHLPLDLLIWYMLKINVPTILIV